MADKNSGDKLLYCSFCGKSQHEVRKLIAGPSVFICDECIELCNDIIKEEGDTAGSGQNIDFTSLSGAPVPTGQSATAIWLNVRTGELAWDPTTEGRLQNPLHLEGPDATVLLAPATALPQAS